MIYAITAIAILISIALALTRAILGPTSYDRILSANAIGTKTVLLIGVMGFLGGRPDFLDLALVYALVNFIGTLAVLKYFKFGTLRGTLSKPKPADNS
ncbi:monovalent cation/H+ antiporter complex subunit F [Sneathiella litorea]|uniref:pH regulation protein F n=1 Tax=Sneathiella litorea TaxID=2606216 RepID=A0A6L8W603_9PROT|nr:pH regulation protein F [Sneathiella litorea]